MTTAPVILLYLLMLILPISALIARRTPLATTIKLSAIWIAIFAIGAGIIRLIQP